MFELKPIKKNIRVEPWDLAERSVYLKSRSDQVWSDALLSASLLVKVKVDNPYDTDPVGRFFGGENPVNEICYTISNDVTRNTRETEPVRIVGR